MAAASRRSLYPEYPLPGLGSGKLFTSPPVPFPGLSIKPNDSFTLVYAPVAVSFTMLPNAVALVTTLSPKSLIDFLTSLKKPEDSGFLIVLVASDVVLVGLVALFSFSTEDLVVVSGTTLLFWVFLKASILPSIDLISLFIA